MRFDHFMFHEKYENSSMFDFYEDNFSIKNTVSSFKEDITLYTSANYVSSFQKCDNFSSSLYLKITK